MLRTIQPRGIRKLSARTIKLKMRSKFQNHYFEIFEISINQIDHEESENRGAEIPAIFLRLQ